MIYRQFLPICNPEFCRKFMSNMENNHSASSSIGHHPMFSFFVLLLFTFAGLFVGNIVGLVSILPFYDFSLEAASEFLSHPMADASGRVPLLLVQGMASFCAFIIAPLAYLIYFEKKGLNQFSAMAQPMLPAVLLTILISQSFMFLNTPIIEWNLNLEFPSFMSGFEEYAQSQEAYLKEITEFVTQFDNIGQFLLAVIIVAVLPGIGEELLFRGLIQQKLIGFLGNPHVAIWIAGFIFGLFHFQFYGLVPRMLLGVLFGYLYWWSGSLLLAMIAHFFNNGFTLLMVYLYQQGAVKFDIEGTSEIPMSTVLVAGVIFGSLFYTFVRFVKHQEIVYE